MESNRPQIRMFRRVPSVVVPTHYDLKLKVLLDSDSFEGEEDVFLLFKERVSSVTFHCGSIIIHWASLRMGTYNFSDLHIHYEKKWDLATIRLPTDIAANQKGLLKLHFTGKLNKDMTGFYISTYEHNKEQVKLASTQFEPNDARNAFPCWDEPMFKATFKITLIVPENKVALSNTEIERHTILATKICDDRIKLIDKS
ncbi:Peptidase M1 domain containing protein [Trichuris trichiura]|uniref:Peptidase M1 domain containing protein n=1 Tax=Trichuris trichiura TaxID=36087 RepID=A0A077ZN99_TRITR|nr:Peptidase M1 domain containing protein [Trichuris trichiura]